MVYARYIKKGKKRLGPYYYKSVRTPEGKVRNVYVGKSPETRSKKEKTLSPLKAGFILLFILALAFGLSYTSFFIAKESIHTQVLDIKAGENMSYFWVPENPGNSSCSLLLLCQ